MNYGPMFPHQSKLFHEFFDHLDSSDKRTPILAMATGTGKGRLSIEIISEMIKKNPKARFLVLPHAQVILKSNFVKELEKWQKYNINHVTIEDKSTPSKTDLSKYNLIVCLPQTANNIANKFGKIDYIVIDEAHQRYAVAGRDDDETVKKQHKSIRNALGNPKELLLTASHSPFSNKDFKKFTFSLIEGFKDDKVSDVALVCVNTKWDFKLEEDSSRKKNIPSQVRDGLEELIKSMSLWHFEILAKHKTLMNVARTPAALFKEGKNFPKTMIACSSTDSANAVYDWFNKGKLKDRVIKSHCLEVERKGYTLEDFRNDDNLRVAVVVRRGNLGFDCNALQCVVDMTCTMDENLIMQLIGRAARVGIDSSNNQMEKVFFKVMPQNMEMHTRAIMQLSALLMTPDFYKTYQGRAPERMVTVFKKGRTGKRRDPKGRGGDFIPVPARLSDLTKGAHHFFTEYARKFGTTVEAYCRTSMKDIQKISDGKVLVEGNWIDKFIDIDAPIEEIVSAYKKEIENKEYMYV